MSGGRDILRDANGHSIFAFVRYYGISYNNNVEIRALLDGLNFCVQMNITHIKVETDSKLVVKWWDQNDQVPWRSHTYWHEAKLKPSSLVMRISHIFREKNHIADRLAKLGFNGNDIFFANKHGLSKDILGTLQMD